MDIINRFDIYNGHFVEEAANIVESWGNRKAYKDCDKYQHLANNMNGWLAEHFFKVTFKTWEFINELEHDYLCKDSAVERFYRAGKPDFIKDTETAEVKAYKNEATIRNKIDSWKINNKELHNATYVYILNWEDHNWYELKYKDDWSLVKICHTVWPSWYKGKFFLLNF